MNVWVVVDEQAFAEVPEQQRWGVRPTHVAETAEELERLIGTPPGALAATLTRYNEFASRAEDPDFHKAARRLRPLRDPLAAIDVRTGMRPPAESGDRRGTGASVFTLGGLHGEGYISGTSLGEGTYFGRRAGRAAARTA